MSFNYVQRLVLLVVVASVLEIGVANKELYSGFNYTNYWGFNKINASRPYTNYTNYWGFNKNASQHQNCTDGPNKIVVGGSAGWRFGFNYSEWAFNNGPFYINDTLVFKFDPPSSSNPFAHSVYLLPNFWSYWFCDLTRAKMIADTMEGGGDGFEFKLNHWRTYYFACGEHNGTHCSAGGMKFFVMPLFRRWHF